MLEQFVDRSGFSNSHRVRNFEAEYKAFFLVALCFCGSLKMQHEGVAQMVLCYELLQGGVSSRRKTC